VIVKPRNLQQAYTTFYFTRQYFYESRAKLCVLKSIKLTDLFHLSLGGCDKCVVFTKHLFACRVRYVITDYGLSASSAVSAR